MISLPFIIILGDEKKLFLNRIVKNLELVMDFYKKHGWGLYKDKNSIYWHLDDIVERLDNQFMIYNNPEIYYIVNYGSQNHYEQLLNKHKMVHNSIKHKKIKESVLSLNYSIKIDEMKNKVIDWCNNNNIEYIDTDNI